MDINYTIVGAVLVVIVLLIVFLIIRNKKDQKDFEKEAGDAEIKPDQHDNQQR